MNARLTKKRVSVALLCLFLSACSSLSKQMAENKNRNTVDYADQAAPLLSPEQQKVQERKLQLKLLAQMIDQGAYYAALAHSDAYEKKWGADPQAKLLKADALRLTQQLDPAGQLYQELVTANAKTRPQALHGLGKVAAQKGQWKTAETQFLQALKDAPLNAGAYNDLGLVHLMLNQRDAAFVALRKADELDPEKNQAKANLALFAAIYNEDAMFETLSSQLAWKPENKAAVKSQALKIRSVHSGARPTETNVLADKHNVRN
jgi:Flp pilus assembly protein TadD